MVNFKIMLVIVTGEFPSFPWLNTRSIISPSRNIEHAEGPRWGENQLHVVIQGSRETEAAGWGG